MKPSIEQIHRYLDSELESAELRAFELQMAGDEGLRREVEQLRGIGLALREHPGFDFAQAEVPHADFFNTHLMRQIEQEQRLGRSLSDDTAPARWLAWLRLPWLVAAGATAVAVFSLLQSGPTDATLDPGRTAVVSTYAPDPSVKSTVYFAEAAGATVIELSGIDEIPDEQIITGRDLGSHAAGRGLAVTLRDATGRPVAALMPDLADGAPVFRALSLNDQG